MKYLWNEEIGDSDGLWSTELWTQDLFVPECFTPAELFRGGVNGVWFDPSDLNTLYQDATGLIPVTAADQPVGLMLDKSKSAGTIGSNMIPSIAEGWTCYGGTTTTLVNGKLVYTVGESGGNSSIYRAFPTVVGRTYQVSITISADAMTGSTFLYVGGEPIGLTLYSNNNIFSGPITFTTSFVAVTDLSLIVITGGIAQLSGETITISQLIFREFIGNHASQTTDAKRPMLRSDGRLWWLEFDGVDDCMVTSSMSLHTFFYLGIGQSNQNQSKPFFIEHGFDATINSGFFLYGVNGAAFIIKRSGRYQPDIDNVYWAGLKNSVCELVSKSDKATAYKDKSVMVFPIHASFTNQLPNSVETLPLNIMSRGQIGLFSSASIFQIVLIDDIDINFSSASVYKYIARKTGVTL